MDDHRFDTLIRSLTTAHSRRRALGSLVGGALGVVGWRAVEEVDAHNAARACKKKSGKARKRCLKSAKKHNAAHTTQASPPPPPPVCSPACGTCQQCVNGACVRAPDSTLCGRCKECFAGACEPVPDGRRCGTCLECKAGMCVNQECLTCEDCIDDVCRPRQCSPPHLCQTNCQCDPAIDRCGCEDVVCLPGHCQGNCACNERLGCMCDFQC